MAVRAKFTVTCITQHSWSKEARTVKLAPQYDPNTPEDQRYSKATPSGEISMQIDNPPVAAQFELGKTFYVDFTEASA